MRIMREKRIFAVPTFAIVEYFAAHAAPRPQTKRAGAQEFHAPQFKQRGRRACPRRRLRRGPFPHGTQAREYELMVKYGMSPAETLHSGLINGAKLLDWENQIGQLKSNFYADIIAVPGNPLEDIKVLAHPTFVMKNGEVIRKD